MEQGVKLNSVTFALSNNGKNNQVFNIQLHQMYSAPALALPCVHGSWPSGIQVIHAPRDNLGTHSVTCGHICCVCERTHRKEVSGSHGKKYTPKYKKITECFGTLSKTSPDTK